MSRHVSVESNVARNRNERRRLHTRQQILESTAALLAELGYDSLTVQDITDDVDIARATFYIHFKDKEEAVWEVLEEHFSQLVALLGELEESDSERRRYLKLVGLCKYVAAHKQLMSVLLSENSHIKLFRRIVEFMAESLEQDINSGRVVQTTTMTPEFEANFYAGATLQSISWWLKNAPDMVPHELAGMIYEIIQQKPPPEVRE